MNVFACFQKGVVECWVAFSKGSFLKKEKERVTERETRKERSGRTKQKSVFKRLS
jgi:hypothetical protein